jgi:hypothetical protein
MKARVIEKYRILNTHQVQNDLEKVVQCYPPLNLPKIHPRYIYNLNIKVVKQLGPELF